MAQEGIECRESSREGQCQEDREEVGDERVRRETEEPRSSLHNVQDEGHEGMQDAAQLVALTVDTAIPHGVEDHRGDTTRNTVNLDTQGRDSEGVDHIARREQHLVSGAHEEDDHVVRSEQTDVTEGRRGIVHQHDVRSLTRDAPGPVPLPGGDHEDVGLDPDPVDGPPAPDDTTVEDGRGSDTDSEPHGVSVTEVDSVNEHTDHERREHQKADDERSTPKDEDPRPHEEETTRRRMLDH